MLYAIPSQSSLSNSWLPIISCHATFPHHAFEPALLQLINHPEYNSTLILRAEHILVEQQNLTHLSLPSLSPIRHIHRRLLPRRPERDPPIDQICTLYASDRAKFPLTLVLTPVLSSPTAPLPYYHPSVFHLAFSYIPSDDSLLQIDALPLPNTPTDPNSRLFRTCLSLLETLQRYGNGVVSNYQKRVLHDRLVPREVYQDLYLVMRQRHKYLVDTWQEVTDPLKHVFEDIGIATFLMLFWKASFERSQDDPITNPSEPWRSWPRPPNGFLDLGCGNGLLTHILISEGYTGTGIDVRARSSWSHYPRSTQSALKVHALNPTLSDGYFFQSGTFIIGNHADELTPWIPVLSTLSDASGYLSIPCCSWAFDAKFDRNALANYSTFFPIPSGDDDDAAFVQGLNLGNEGNRTSSYSMYRIWLARLSLYCGWKVETEVLRIPSTRNWAIVGRKRVEDLDRERVMDDVKGIVEQVKIRGIFKTRKPEGKANGEH